MKLIKVVDEPIKIELSVCGRVAAGYPAEAYNYIENNIDLNRYIIRNKSQTRCLWSTHSGLTGEGISLTDLLVIDKGVKPKESSILLFWYDGEYTLRRIVNHSDHVELVSINPDIKAIIYSKDESAQQLGVLTFAIKKFFISKDLKKETHNFIEEGIDFNNYILSEWWETCFLLWCGGDSMSGDGIEKGDLLVIDRLKDPYEDSIQVFYLNREFTMKRVTHKKDHYELISSNPDMKPIIIDKSDNLQRWGVLTCAIKKYI